MNYEELVNTYGTPLYVFDTNTLLNRIHTLKSYFKDKNICYAVKANTFIAKELENEVERFEICSPGEFEICEKLNIDHSKMVISGVYKDEDTIEKIISRYDDIGKFTIESLSQWQLLEHMAKKYNRKLHVLIRLTSGNQFGVKKEEVMTIIQNYNSELLEIDGIEFFSGTQKHSIKRVNKEIDTILEIVEEIESLLNFEVKEIEYGPGLPVFYYEGDEFDEAEFLTEVNAALDRIQNKKISIETGRSIAASCGTYLTKVVDLKENEVGKFALVDGGIHHVVYYGGNLAMKVPHYEVLPKRKGIEETYNLCGSLCTINDILVKNITLPKLELGDIFVFKNTGAYSVTEGISLFLSRDLPKVLICDKNCDIIVARDTSKTSILNYPNYKEGEK